MIRKIIALLIVAVFLVPSVSAEPAIHFSLPCNLFAFGDGNVYTGAGETNYVILSDGDGNEQCHGQLDAKSSVPEKTIVIFDRGFLYTEIFTITPSGQFSIIRHT